MALLYRRILGWDGERTGASVLIFGLGFGAGLVWFWSYREVLIYGRIRDQDPESVLKYIVERKRTYLTSHSSRLFAGMIECRVLS